MYCRYCGENNPEEAVFCKNCGKKLKEDVKKVEVVERPKENQNNNQKSTTTTHNSSNDNSDWIGCCMCLIAIFIIFAITGSF